MFKYAIIGTGIVGAGIVGAGISINYYHKKGQYQLRTWLLPIDSKTKYQIDDSYRCTGEHFFKKHNYSLVEVISDEKVLEKFWKHIAAYNLELKNCPEKYLTKELIDLVRDYNINSIISINDSVIDILVERINTTNIKVGINPVMMKPVLTRLKELYPDTYLDLLKKVVDPLVTPEELKHVYPGPYYKVVHPDSPHYDMTYSEEGGIYEDTKPFDSTMCTAGGIHGATRSDLLSTWIRNICVDEKCVIFDVDIDKDADCGFNYDKFKCSKLTLKNPRSVEAFMNE